MVRVLLTGASEDGIGGAIARRLTQDAVRAREDISIVLSATGSKPGLRLLGTELENQGARVGVLAADLSAGHTPGRLAEAAEEFCGGLDLVVSAAGRSQHGQLADLDAADWDYMLDLHARAAWLLAAKAFPALKASGGSFIAIGSASGTFPHAGSGAYAVAKAALIMLCQTLAIEWGAAGVRVNVISPGLIAIARSTKEFAGSIVPLGRPGLPAEIAGIVSFLAGPDAAYVTGQNIVADGGLTGAALELIRHG